MSFQRPDPIREAGQIIVGAARGDYDETVGRGVERVIDTATGNVRPRDSGMRGGRPAPRPPVRRAARESDLEQTTGISRAPSGDTGRPVLYWTLEECRGRGGTYTPYDPNTRAPRCDNIPAPRVPTPPPDDDLQPLQPPEGEGEPVHVDDPVDATGEQVPDCNHGRSGNRLLVVGGADCHERQVQPTAQGGGSHSGRDGSKTHAGTEDVVNFDTGGKRSYLARQENPVLKSINLINALQDPYGEFRVCKSEKRLVE